MIGLIGAPVFLREILATSRRPRTYALQTLFLSALVLCLIPLWPQSMRTQSGAEIADTGRLIFEYGAYLQVLLLALLAPATTANAITQEKDGNTLDLLLLTGAGPFAIVWGKFFSRLFNLSFLLFLTLPLLFALLTLGGVSATSILVGFTVLVAFAVLGAGLGVFLSTILARTSAVLIGGYLLVAAVLAAPLLLAQLGLYTSAPGTYPLVAAYLSPLYDLIYLFQPYRFVATEHFPTRWWVCPLWNVSVGLGLVLAAGLIIPYARSVERVLSLRRAFEAVDRGTYLLLRPRLLLARLRGVPPVPTVSAVRARPVGSVVPAAPAAPGPAAEPGAVQAGPTRSAPRGAPAGMNVQGNPIYWKETSVNTIGRFKYWWRANLFVLVAMAGCYLLFQTALEEIGFHQVVVAVLAGVVVLLSTVIAATTVSQEREDGSLVLLATTPLDCATYVKGKVRGIGRNIVFLVALPFLHAAIFVGVGVIHPVTFLLLLLAIPIAVVAAIMQGVLVSLLCATTFRAIMAGIVILILQAALPLVCCLPAFNLPVTAYYTVLPVEGAWSGSIGSTQESFMLAMGLALLFSAGTQIGYTIVVYSLIRSGFDRYIGRAG